MLSFLLSSGEGWGHELSVACQRAHKWTGPFEPPLIGRPLHLAFFLLRQTLFNQVWARLTAQGSKKPDQRKLIPHPQGSHEGHEAGISRLHHKTALIQRRKHTRPTSSEIRPGKQDIIISSNKREAHSLLDILSLRYKHQCLVRTQRFALHMEEDTSFFHLLFNRWMAPKCLYICTRVFGGGAPYA